MHQGVKVLLVLIFVTAGGFVFMRGLTPGFPDLQNIPPTQKQVIKEPIKEPLKEPIKEPLKEPPCTCEKCLSEEEQWILNRWDKSVHPFLSAQYKLPLTDYNWWRGLQLDRHDYDYYSQMVERLFKLFPPDPDVVKASPDLCRTCAVVGNSGNLKGSRYGPLIDFHDVIIRINHGRTNGFEADVGRRTTHRIMYPESSSDLDNSTHLVLFPFKTMDLDWLQKAFTTGFSGRSYAPIRSRIRANKDLVMVLNPGFMKYVHEKWLDKKGSYSSTGFMALILALHICDEVHVFGFGADKDGNWSHYWEDLKNKRFGTGIHPGKHEYDAIIRLARAIKIKLYKGR